MKKSKPRHCELGSNLIPMKTPLLIFALLILSVAVNAQAPSLPPPPSGAAAPNEAAPLDGFTWMLLLSGVGYGAKAIRDNRKS